MNGSLNVAQAFTSLAIITLSTNPLSALVSAIPNIGAGLGCFGRIQECLLLPARADQRTLTALNESELVQESATPAFDSSFKSIDNEIKASDPTTLVTLNNCTFGEPPLLHDVDLKVQRSSLTMIVGPNGSEVEITKGTLQIATTRLAFCSQEPWMMSGSIRQNIVGYSGVEDDLSWYQTVLKFCALDKDLMCFVEGDERVVSSGGVNLSGGQRQRIYDYLGDTPQFLHAADLVVVLASNGTIHVSGPFKELNLSPANLDDSAKETSEDGELQVSKLEIKTTVSKGRQGTLEDINRRIGDLSTCWYYFKSIGRKYGLAYLALYVGYVFFYKFPSEHLLKCWFITNFVTEVWLQFWTENNERSSGRDSNVYLSVYRVLTALSLIFVSVTIWPDHPSKPLVVLKY
ncbi:MAG: hypothetical protein M1818_003254 [Claussenomyces sp. TS43310]|nr:MAG: hypothetical protein M1818_003254 [Claussenomyces sp. TS43310]